MKQDIGFKTFPELKKDYVGEDGLTYYSLKADLVFHDGENDIIIKPFSDGGTFYTNLASTPKFLHFMIPPDKNLYKYPSILHDFLYSSRDVSRRYADKIFLIAIKSELKRLLKDEDNPRTKLVDRIRYNLIAYSFWAMVRIFGKSFRV